MKPAKVILAIVLGTVAIFVVWGVLSTAIVWIVGVIKGIFALALGIAVIGGLGWLILRLIGKKSITSGKHRSLP